MIKFLIDNKTKKTVFILCLMVFVYYFLVLHVISDVYEYAVVGAIFEMSSFPMLSLLLILPVVTLIQIVKEKLSIQSFPVYSFIVLSGVLILFLIYWQ